MNLAVIPARGGSKRIPRKNIKEFCGKPIIAWSIEAARESGCFDRVIVSTDDSEIAEVARQWGAEVPFMRPAELSDDYTGTIEVIAHAINWINKNSIKPEYVCCIYATAPFVRIRDLQAGLNILEEGKWDYVFSATKFPSTIFRSFQQTLNGGVEMLFPDHYSKRSQDFPEVLHDAGQFYWGRSGAWINSSTKIFSLTSTVLYIPPWRVQDIDTEEDWCRAELIYQYGFSKSHQNNFENEI